ncbi:hypothetical protein D3C85_1368250 [compost metagenome]
MLLRDPDIRRRPVGRRHITERGADASCHVLQTERAHDNRRRFCPCERRVRRERVLGWALHPAAIRDVQDVGLRPVLLHIREVKTIRPQLIVAPRIISLLIQAPASSSFQLIFPDELQLSFHGLFVVEPNSICARN